MTDIPSDVLARIEALERSIPGLRARIAELEIALEPFADLGWTFIEDPETVPIRRRIVWTTELKKTLGKDALPTVDDFRRAALALEGVADA